MRTNPPKPPPGLPARVTRIRGNMAFVMPLDPASAPPEIADGDWFRTLMCIVGDKGLLWPPVPGGRFQDWLFERLPE